MDRITKIEEAYRERITKKEARITELQLLLDVLITEMEEKKQKVRDYEQALAEKIRAEDIITGTEDSIKNL